MSHERPIVHLYNKTTQGSKKMSNIQKEIQVKLTKGLLDMIVLQFLNEQPMHGYQIISKVRKTFGVYFGPSTIYPLLISLEKKGYVSSDWNMQGERPRKVYTLTNGGQNLLNFTENSLNLIVKTIGANNTLTHANEMQQNSPTAPYFLKKKTISALAH
jgi:PadR family transcriptional regulator PadR